jgi:hypothetical protein
MFLFFIINVWRSQLQLTVIVTRRYRHGKQNEEPSEPFLLGCFTRWCHLDMSWLVYKWNDHLPDHLTLVISRINPSYPIVHQVLRSQLTNFMGKVRKTLPLQISRASVGHRPLLRSAQFPRASDALGQLHLQRFGSPGPCNEGKKHLKHENMKRSWDVLTYARYPLVNIQKTDGKITMFNG